MLFASRSPITRLLTAALYGAAAIFGQGLHLLACADHDHSAGHHLAGGCQVADACQQAGEAIASQSDEHDADQCPICQYHSQGQWYGVDQRDAHSTALESLVPHLLGRLWRQSLDRPLGPRGPPCLSANLA